MVEFAPHRGRHNQPQSELPTMSPDTVLAGGMTLGEVNRKLREIRKEIISAPAIKRPLLPGASCGLST